MEFRFKPEEEALLAEVRDFIKREATPELIKETLHNEGTYGGQEARKFFKNFAAKGWLASNWPKEYGGLGLSNMMNYMVRDELSHAGLPFKFNGLYMAGPTIMRVGSDYLKEKFLLPLARAEIEIALGYTEPDAGSDLMSLTTYAEDKGDHFVVNGQKIFNTLCHMAEWVWLAVRTDRDAPKHRGISMMIVDIKTPGITVEPLWTMSGTRTNVVYYDNVIVPKENLAGEKNKGVYYLMAALDHERTFPFGDYRAFFEKVVNYAKTTKVNGRPLSQDPVIRQELAELAIELEATKLLYYQIAHILDKGGIPHYQASMQKLYFSEMTQHIAKVAARIFGFYTQLDEGDKWAPIEGDMSHYYRQCVIETIYAGTSEIQRNIMAVKGLGLPR